MKAPHAALEIIDFKINELHFKYIAPDGFDDEDLTNLPVEINFDFLQGTAKNGFSIDLEVNSNYEINKIVPGYSFQVKAFTEFFFNEEKMPKTGKSFSLFQSGLEISLGHVRGYLAMLSSFGPMGSYYLPILDLIKIFEQKFKDLQQKHPQMKVVKK